MTDKNWKIKKFLVLKFIFENLDIRLVEFILDENSFLNYSLQFSIIFTIFPLERGPPYRNLGPIHV